MMQGATPDICLQQHPLERVRGSFFTLYIGGPSWQCTLFLTPSPASGLTSWSFCSWLTNLRGTNIKALLGARPVGGLFFSTVP